jgi:hypothetical protein
VANSLAQFRGHGFWVTDNVLQLWLAFLCDEFDKEEELPECLRDLAEEWRTVELLSGGGTVQPQLDLFLQSDEHISILLLISQRVIQRLKDLADQGRRVVSTQDLSLVFGEEYEQFSAYTQHLLLIGDAFVRLLKGEILEPHSQAKRIWSPVSDL